MNEDFDIAQICTNGHVVNTSSTRSPAFNEDFCTKCGVKTIQTCPNCDKGIRGHVAGDFSIHYERPNFCHNCGKPYPWTQAIQMAALEYAEISGKFSEDEIDDLTRDLQDLVAESPRSPVAQAKIKGKLKKAGNEFARGFRDILVDIVSETIQKSIWGP